MIARFLPFWDDGVAPCAGYNPIPPGWRWPGLGYLTIREWLAFKKESVKNRIRNRKKENDYERTFRF